MPAVDTSSELVLLNSMDIESARNILSVLIRQGGPVQLHELTSRSAVPQNLVELLCCIPGSPLTFTSGGIVGISDVPGDSFIEFMNRSVALYVPRDVFRFPGLRSGNWNVSVTYVRKRKAQSLDKAVVVPPNSKRRSFLNLSGLGESKHNQVPMVLSSSNESPREGTFDVTSPKNEQRSVGMDTLDSFTIGLDQSYNFSAPLSNLNYTDIGNISCTSEERACAPSINNYVFPHREAVDFSFERVSSGVGLYANFMKEQAFQSSSVVEHDFRPLLERMLYQPSLVNENLEEDSSTLSLELGFFSGIPEVHPLERLKMIEKDFEASLKERECSEIASDHIALNSQNANRFACRKQPINDSIDERKPLIVNENLEDDFSNFSLDLGCFAGIPEVPHLERQKMFKKDFGSYLKGSVWDEIASDHIDHNSQNNFLLACRKQVAEGIEERKSHSKDDKLIATQLESSGTLVASRTTNWHTKEKTTLTCAHGDDAQNASAIAGLQNIAGSNIASNGTSYSEDQYKFLERSSEKKLVPNPVSFIIEEGDCSGHCSTVCKAQMKEGGNIYAVKCVGESVKDEGSPKLFSLSDQIPRKVNFDVQSPSHNEHHSIGMDILDCSIIGLDQSYNMPVRLHDLSYFELRNSSYNREEDTRESAAPCITNSVDSHIKDIEISEDIPFDIGLKAYTTKLHAFQGFREMEPDFRPLSDRVLDQPSIVNRALGDNFLHHLDDNAQNASLLACRNPLVNDAIDERKLHSKDDKLISVQLESNEIIVASRPSHFCRKEISSAFAFGDDTKYSAAIVEPATMDELADVSEEKQRTFSNPGIMDHIASVGLQNLVGSNFASNSPSSTKGKYRNVEVGFVLSQKVKDICNVNMPSKENGVDAVTKPSKNSSEQKLMPNFESFIIEEEEGSGGYGTVYKAQRKADGKIFAVKCPHANAHSHHVHNELKMLERFGGCNFVIKYEGSFKNGDSECFVLEHVEHDRPEVLKKEISLFELQWYGFCMFKALSSLHKQGVVHRDVKPGNFLFSRNVNKGYLIDFNLASDLHQKFCRSSKRKMPSASANPMPLLELKSSSSILSRKFIDRRLLENSRKETPNESKKVQSSKALKKKYNKDHEDGFPAVDRSKHGSQTADVSGLTSTKDQTSSKTPGDWLNQPMPSKGRKELINFVHKAMHSTQNMKPISNGPSSQRKRVAAPMAPANDTGLLILTPMPLHSGGNAVAGAGLKNNASGKVKREGPCVGTKGFRAPEVLFKSFHQGCKIDMWSAGVTMLYLMIGRAPFGGDPEQNIKEIARLRGSEDLWEVAKLHNCETAFPVDLLDVGALKSMKLRDWCAKSTRRPEFLELVPEALFDLVDRCLAVNPRCRFSAEEALMHKFFAPCHESIRKQRLLRKVAPSDSSSTK